MKLGLLTAAFPDNLHFRQLADETRAEIDRLRGQPP